MQQETARQDIPSKLSSYKAAMETELGLILDWWMHYMIDEQDGGFYGTVANNNQPAPTEKGVVLNSRILWTFSSAYNFSPKEEYLQIAKRAFNYIEKNFIDYRYGGVFWSVDTKGKMKDGRKQIYGLAFCMYGLAEYYKASNDNTALIIAKDLYNTIEQHSFDTINGGYIEAFTREWYNSGDLRLSDKDDNERKTMNTHLHIIEAYANLFSVWPDDLLKERIEMLLGYFDKYIINKQNHHLNLFMDDEWNLRSSLISFGHDIEAAWLLQECAEAIHHTSFINHYKQLAMSIADAAAEGLDANDGGLWYEYEPKDDHWIKEKHWWPQAEAMIGFFNAYQISGDDKYLHYSLNCFDFVKKHIKDNERGEWFWGIEADGTIIKKEKAGLWKCPYHNSRACIELIKRISTL
ncbi:MAG: AGE family epimerase/isomerase [Bacteroidota bacterium]